MNRTRNLIIVVVALAVVIAIAAFAGRGHSATTVRVQRARYDNFTVKLPESGILQRPQTETIPALVAGNIGHILAGAGDRVAAGQLLATIYNPTLEYSAAGSQADYSSANANIDAARVQERNATVGYQAAVATNKSTLDEAQRVYDADLLLYNNKAIPRNQLDADKAKLDQARVAYDQSVEQARLGAVSGYNGNSVQYAIAAADKARIINEQNQQELAFTRVVAPFDGVIQTVANQSGDALRPIQSGDAVSQGQALFTIARGDTFIVRTKVDEQDIAQVAVGQKAIVSGQDFKGQSFAGHVVAIAPTAQKSDDASATSKQVLTDIALDRIAPFMKDGMTTDVDILTTDLRDVLVVPNSAIKSDKDGKYVWTVTRGKIAKRPILTAQSNDSETVVRRGLVPGDQVVTAPSADLQEGMPVLVASPSPSPGASPT